MQGTKAFITEIKQCKICRLCKNQPPLLDKKSKAHVMWVGLSAVKVEDVDKETPLSSSTNTGRLLHEIEKMNDDVSFYKTNLVKCLPLKDSKIRYPLRKEMESCYGHLETEVNKFKPKVVFLLGKQVADFVVYNELKRKLCDRFRYSPIYKDEVAYVPVHHPSYILVYKRKKMNSYMRSVSKIIERFT